MSKTRRQERGVTLMELMVTVVIIGILAAIAYPAYLEQVRKGYRAAAQEHLLDVAQRQQQFFIDNRSYAANLVALNMVTPPDVANRYNIAIAATVGPPPSFTVTGNAIGAQLPDGNLSIDNAGSKLPADKW